MVSFSQHFRSHCLNSQTRAIPQVEEDAFPSLCCLIGNDLRSLQLQRMAAKVPDSEARSILLADKHSVYHSETAQAALKQARTIKKANEAFKPKRMPKDWNRFKRRTGGGDQLPTHVPPVPPAHDASSASSSSSTPYDPNQGIGKPLRPQEVEGVEGAEENEDKGVFDPQF